MVFELMVCGLSLFALYAVGIFVMAVVGVAIFDGSLSSGWRQRRLVDCGVIENVGVNGPFDGLCPDCAEHVNQCRCQAGE